MAQARKKRTPEQNRAIYQRRKQRAQAKGLKGYGQQRYARENQAARARGFKSVGEMRKILKLYADYDTPIATLSPSGVLVSNVEGIDNLGERTLRKGSYPWPDTLDDMDWDHFREWYGGSEIM